MAKQTINIGASPNDGTGTPLRTSFDYCNQNFTELYTATGPSGNNIVVPGNATITGAATVGTTLGVTGASALGGNVGIGAVASAKLSVTDANGIPIRFGDLAAAPASQTACFVGVSTSAFPGHGNGDLILVPRTSDARDVAIYTGSGTAADRLRVTAAGNVNITTGNVVMATSGKGIDFSATASGSGTMTSELLNDYEEGTFTPTVGGSTSNGTATYSTQTGVYTKIGRIVQIQIFVAWSAGTATGTQTVLGLPFVAHGTANNFSILNTYPIDIALTAGHLATSSIPASGSVIDLYQLPTGGGPNANVLCDAAGALLFTGTYTVA